MQGFHLVALTGSAGADVLANKPVVAGDNEVRAKSVQSLLNALVGVGVVELEDGGQRGRRRRDEDALAAKDETLLDSPWGAASLRDGVVEAAQVVVVLQFGAKLGVEAERRTREHRKLGLGDLHPGQGVGHRVQAPRSVLDGEIEAKNLLMHWCWGTIDKRWSSMNLRA